MYSYYIIFGRSDFLEFYYDIWLKVKIYELPNVFLDLKKK